MNKKLNLLKVFFPILFFILAIAMIVPNALIYASASDQDESTAQLENEKSVFYNRMSYNSAIEEESLLLRAEKMLDYIDTELSKNNSNVVIELDKQVIKYESMLAVETSEEQRNKIQRLIETTRELTEENQAYSERNGYADNEFYSDRGHISRSNEVVYFEESLPATIAYFSLKGYDLAAELLTHMRDNTKIYSLYEPVYGSRIIATQQFWDIANGSSTEGSNEFPYNVSVCEKDVFYSIGKYNFKKSENGKIVTITDTYDFEAKSAPNIYNEKEQYMINQMYYAQCLDY